MYWLNNFINYFKSNRNNETDNKMSIRDIRMKNMPISTVGHLLSSGSHTDCIGPGIMIIKQTHSAVEKGRAIRIRKNHPAYFDK